ncbi:hypothetical protein [Lysinibacillus sp. 54212]|uniref:hypothetical protein n=1 Tax=Lysinibacillus sp. 54212 TaxID=3119829 RepID=UPI002FCAC759
MLTITTYIEKKTIDTFGNMQDSFIALNDSLSTQVANRQLKRHKGHKLDGVVVITTTDTMMTNFIDWDDIDFMWMGILEMTLQYKKIGFGVHAMAMNNHERSIKRIITKPANLILFTVKRNPGTFLCNETNNIVLEEEFLSEILNAANEFISFRQKLLNVGNVEGLKKLMSEIQL